MLADVQLPLSFSRVNIILLSERMTAQELIHNKIQLIMYQVPLIVKVYPLKLLT